MVFLSVIALLILSPVMGYIFNVVFLDLMYTEDNFFSSLSHVRKEMKGNFWWTWLLVVAILFCSYFFIVFFSIPQYILFFSKTLFHIEMSSTTTGVLTVFSTIGNFGIHLIQAVICVFFGFHYFSLHEKAHGTGDRKSTRLNSSH